MSIQQNSNILFTEQYTSKNKETLYFCFEKIDNTNRNFWWCYSERSTQITSFLSYLCSSTTQDTYPQYEVNECQKIFGNEDNYHKVMQFIQSKGYFKGDQNPFQLGGCTTSASLLRDSVNSKKEFYIVYASTTPAAELTRSLNPTTLKTIIMSFIWLTKPNSPIVTHEGVFRNPMSFIDVKETHRGLAVPLQKFAAKVALQFFSEKTYMINTPTPAMTAIMSKQLGANLHLGTSFDLERHSNLSEKKQEILKKHPPLLHIGKTEALAKEGVDLSAYLDTPLPPEKIEITAQPNKSLNHCPLPLSEDLTAVVKLSHLANY